MNGKMVLKWMQMKVWLWYCNLNECMILQTMEWIKGNTTKYRMYGHEYMELEIMVWIYGIAIKVLNG